MQRPRQDFFEGEHHGTESLSRAPSGGPGAAASRMVTKFKILKRFEVLENESIFQKYEHFSGRTIRLF